MTRDNLLKRGIVKPPECLFCNEHEIVDHLLFHCVVAKQLWSGISDVFSC
uniref:Reverse transcriptase zinc-binding domain-containing protein n=1 Tax=Aegilops tauschii subsp. strangulata TaxID=200361 RepID=A0A453STM3_AEGTS